MRRKGIYLSLFVVAMMVASCDTGYKIENNKVYYQTWGFSFGYQPHELDSADAATFEDLGKDYGRDAHHAYHEEDLIPGANAKEFHVMSEPYAADDQHVYYDGKLIKGAQASSFKDKTKYMGVDNNDVYWKGYPMNVSDMESFDFLSSKRSEFTQWALDKQYAYFMELYPDSDACKIPVADYSSFHIIKGKPINKDAVISNHYAADKLQVYYKGSVVASADPSTFQEVDWELGADKNHKFQKGELISEMEWENIMKKYK